MTKTTAFQIGDTVNVLHAAHLPREIVSSTGIIERITYQSSDGTPLYWVSSRRTAVTAQQLRSVNNEPPADWVWHDIKCAHRRFGSERAACDCGYVSLTLNVHRIPCEKEDPTERAAHAVYGAVADFILAIEQAQTVRETLRLFELITPLVSVLERAESKALDRADTLNS